MDFTNVSVAYMKSILERLNPCKAVGCVNISQRLLPYFSSRHSFTADHSDKLSFSTSSWPTVWKSSNISHVFRKGEETDKTCYRPVSVLTALSKVYERVIADQTAQTRTSTNLSDISKGVRVL